MYTQAININANYQGESGRATSKGPGSILERLIISVFDTATASVLLAEGPDGSGASATVKTLVTTNSLPNGLYVIPIMAMSRKGNWSVGTGAGCRVVCITPHPKDVT